MSSIVDYPALRRSRMQGGVGARTAMLIWCGAGTPIFVVGLPWGLVFLVLGAIVHGGIRWFFLQDEKIFETYRVHSVVPNNLLAGGPAHGDAIATRPSGYAKTIHMS
jgi:hypothetical protein